MCPAALAELDLVDVIGDGGILSADGTRGVAAQGNLGESRLEGVEEEEPAHERLADPKCKLERLARLERADDAGEDAEHAAFGAARGELGRRRLRKEAPVARALVGLEHGRLALEAV